LLENFFGEQDERSLSRTKIEARIAHVGDTEQYSEASELLQVQGGMSLMT
jgi:hypothetical protein